VCHTRPGRQPFAGGYGLQTPFGTVYSTNITPEPETGIGRWSLEAFTRAMHEGDPSRETELQPDPPREPQSSLGLALSSSFAALRYQRQFRGHKQVFKFEQLA
jgi:hypothetical protein